MRRAAAIILVAALTACTTNGSDEPREWSLTKANFGLGGSTAEPIPVDRVLPDGRYWGTLHEVLGSGDVVFDITRARFGAECETWAKEQGMQEGCANDYAVDTSTRQFLKAGDVEWVSIADPAGPGRSYRVSLSTLTKLVRHEQVDVPAGFSWTDFPFIVTVEDGRTVGIDQYWVP